MSNIDVRHPSDARLLWPSYPKAFFEKSGLNQIADRVFVIMPFGATHSKALWEVLQDVCKDAKLDSNRADTSRHPRQIFVDILAEIHKASIIIADLTGLNANVAYELGIAHCHCENVILISDRETKLPFDLAPQRFLFFKSAKRTWRKEFANELGKTLVDIRTGRIPILIDGRENRGEAIIRDLETLSQLPDAELCNQTVWSSSFLSALAISPHEPYKDQAYHRLVLKEKELLISLAKRGCRLRLIITPPTESNVAPTWVEHARTRTKTLLDFMRTKNLAHRNIDWAVSIMRQKNVYIIGEISCIEGIKQHVQKGYHLSIRQTATDAILVNLRVFETLFERFSEYTLKQYRIKSRSSRIALRKATIRSLCESTKFLKTLPKGKMDEYV